MDPAGQPGGWGSGGRGSGGFAALEPPAHVTSLDDVAVVGEPVEQRGGHLGVAEHGRPFAERQVGGDHDRGLFVELADEVERGGSGNSPGDCCPPSQLATGERERQVAELVEDHEVEPGEVVGDPARLAGTGFGLEPVDQIDGVEVIYNGRERRRGRRWR